MVDIETHVRKFMSFRGIDYEGRETRPNVLSAVNHRLVAAGYAAQWQLVVDKHPLNHAKSVTLGFKLALAPKPDVYQETISAGGSMTISDRQIDARIR
jgi:hypothetical protein